MPALNPCPFCGTPDPFINDHIPRTADSDPRTGRIVICRDSKCQASMFRARCWFDDTRLETTEELDANLAERWNARS